MRILFSAPAGVQQTADAERGQVRSSVRALRLSSIKELKYRRNAFGQGHLRNHMGGEDEGYIDLFSEICTYGVAANACMEDARQCLLF